MSLWDFARRAGSEDGREADRASLLSAALLAFEDGADLGLTPGAGLVASPGHLGLVVFADSDRTGLKPGSLLPIREVRMIAARVIDALRDQPDWLWLIDVLAITPPRRHLAPGGAITGWGLGTIGTQVRWNAGSGFLTAGHVAPSLGTIVYDGSTAVGKVVWTNDPAGHGTAIEPDTAVAELNSGLSLSNPIAAAASAGPAATVSVLSSGNAGTIMGLSQFLFMPSQNATCGDTYFTTSEITSPGDSGGPVLAGPDVIGHVVGASPNVTSFVQDINYQLREASNPLRSGLPGLRI